MAILWLIYHKVCMHYGDFCLSVEDGKSIFEACPRRLISTDVFEVLKYRSKGTIAISSVI